MSLKEPESVEDCVYYTNRNLGEKGKARVWVLRNKCPKCSHSLMGKPVEKGKVKIRAEEYICPECNYKAKAEEYEASLTASIKYTCPYCTYSGELEIPFKRKNIQVFDEETGKKKTIEALRFQCAKCGKNIDITKKMR